MNALDGVAAEIGELVKPLAVVATDARPPRELRRLLRAAGWSLPGLDAVDVDGLAGTLTAATDAVAALPATIRSGDLQDVAASLIAIGAVVGDVRSLVDGFEDLIAAAVGTDADETASLATDLAEDVWQTLVVRWLGRRHATTFRLLRATGVVTNDPVPPLTAGGVTVRSGARALRFRPANVTTLVGDPLGTLREIYATEPMAGSADAQAAALLAGSMIRPVVAALGGELTGFEPWGWLDELPAAERDRAARSITLGVPLLSPEGSAFRPRVEVLAEVLSPSDRGVLGRSGPGVELSLSGLASLDATVGATTLDLDVVASAGTVFVGPDDVVGEGGGVVDVTATVSREIVAPAVLGADGGTRLELGAPKVRARVLLDPAPPEPGAGFDVEVELALTGAALVIGAGDGDSFLGNVLPDAELRVDADLGLVWSRQRGLRLTGAPDLALRIPAGIGIGNFAVVEVLGVTLALTDDGFVVTLTGDVSFTLGPFFARVDGLGLRLEVDLDDPGGDRDGNLGVAHLTVAFQPPLGVEFEIAIGTTIVGGGFVRYDPLLERYSGALGLQILAVELGAIVVVDTRLPDDPDGWALFASLFLTFPSIPLGFGFSLSGVGGLVCLNRSMDSLAIAAGLREGAIDAILFPDDPVNDAAFIITQLDNWFPLEAGSTVFGIAATITWGVPKTLVTAQVGAMIVLPELQIAVVGSVEVVLPDSDERIVELHLDTIGSYDSAEHTLLVVASLYDSTLLGTIDLSGDMAMYGRFGADPYFLLSIGGYHPEFRPPAGLPDEVLDLRRMRAAVALSDDVWFALETYVAITSNTFQFGALVSLEASVRVLGTTYTASGHVGFDVLLTFSPFSFLAGFSAGVAITAGSSENELVAATLDGRLEGPDPWSASGSARFTFLGFDVRFEFAVGGAAGIEAKPLVNVLDLVVEALEDIAAWSATVPAGTPVALADEVPDEPAETDDPVDPATVVLRARPDADIVVRQGVAPLGRPMDVYGVGVIDGPTTIGLDTAGITGAAAASHEPVTDWFAPAMFDIMPQADRLSAPSYEEMEAGARIVAGPASWGAATQTVIADYEVRTVTASAEPATTGRGAPVASTAVVDRAGMLDPAVRRLSPRTTTLPARFGSQDTGWVLADASSGRAAGTVGSYRQCLERLARRRAAGTARDDLVLVPAHAVRSHG